MNRAQVLTPWVQTGAAFRPRLPADHAVHSWVDVTGQPATALLPSPNLYTVEVVCDDATLVAVEADANYVVLWSEPL
jgi:hypothetical protein